MRITPDLVAQSPQFTNPLKDREIKLRAYKIPAIENLGATQDQFDTIDLSDNEIRKLEVRCTQSISSPSLSFPAACIFVAFLSPCQGAELVSAGARRFCILVGSHAGVACLILGPGLWWQNFPLLKRLKTLLVSNNLIFRIGDDLKDSLPNVHTIMLANNSLLNLSDLKPFASLPALRRLCLIDNNVTKQVCVYPRCNCL